MSHESKQRSISNLSILLLGLLFSGCGKASFNPKIPGQINSVPSALTSKLRVSPNNVADGITAAEITIEIRDVSGSPLSGVSMTMTATGSENVVVPCQVSDVRGLSHCKLYSTKSEQKTIQVQGAFTLQQDILFAEPNPSRSAFAFVSSSGMDQLPGGQKIIATSGISESDTVQRDTDGTIRLHSSVLGSVLND